MRIEEGIDAGHQIRTAVVLAVEVLVAAGGDFERRAAVQADDGRDGPAVDDLLDDAGSPEVVDVPQAGDAGHVALIVIHRSALLPQVVPVLRGGDSNGRLVRTLEGMAPDVVAVEEKVVGEGPVGRDLQRVIRRGLVGGEIDVLAQNAGIVRTAIVDAGL